METKNNLKYIAKFYSLLNGRVLTSTQVIYSDDIKGVIIPNECMIIEIYTFDGNSRIFDDKSAVKIERYSIEGRVDRNRSNFTDEREKVSFLYNKAYRPSTILLEKDIKKGKYCPQSQSTDENV